MRKFVVTLLTLLSLCGCKKDTHKNSKAEWTIDGENQQTATVNYNPASNQLYAGTPPGPTISIHFGGRPTANFTYAVVDLGPNPNPADTECTVAVLGLTHNYDAVGKAGDHVDVTVSSGGKLTATFTNISMRITAGSTTDTLLLSGTIIE